MADRVKVKNKNPAPIQITAEQLVREAQERQDPLFKAPEQRVANTHELQEYRQERRMYLENKLRRNRSSISVYIQYALWEESQGEMERARSVFERGLELNYRNESLWLKYVEFELRHKNINHCRNLLDRATSTLPRVNMFWYKYVWMEELLGEYNRVREVFERWIKWEPEESVWAAYLQFEKRYGELDLARKVNERFVGLNPEPKNWIKWAKFEEENGSIAHARAVYEAALSALTADQIDQNFYISFAKFEVRQKNLSKARELFKSFLAVYGSKPHDNLLNEYNAFEKQFGSDEDVEQVVLARRRKKYQGDIRANPQDYDAWIDYTQLEESYVASLDAARAVYKCATESVPLKQEKTYWSRYIYLWLYYALFEEVIAKDTAKANDVYVAAIRCVPHDSFTFAKLWLQYAYFLLRNDDLAGARQLIDRAISSCPKPKIFKGAIEFELRLRDFARVRALYEQYLEFEPASCSAWLKYAELETLLGDFDRARGIYDIAIEQPVLDEPEQLWKSYIDFEIDQSAYENAYALYEKLLSRTSHVKAWLAFAAFAQDSLFVPPSFASNSDAARAIYERASESLRAQSQRLRLEYASVEGEAESDTYFQALSAALRDRLLLLEKFLEFEKDNGESDRIAAVESKLPRLVQKKRRLYDADANAPSDDWEEYYDYEFPEDDSKSLSEQFLKKAHLWKQKLEQEQSDDSRDSSESLSDSASINSVDSVDSIDSIDSNNRNKAAL